MTGPNDWFLVRDVNGDAVLFRLAHVSVISECAKGHDGGWVSLQDGTKFKLPPSGWVELCEVLGVTAYVGRGATTEGT